MESYPPEFADKVQGLARAAALWAALDAVGDDGAAEKMDEVEQNYQGACEIESLGGDPMQLKDMALAASEATAAEFLKDGDGADDKRQAFSDACEPVPEEVSESLWRRTQDLYWASARWACAEQQGEDAQAQREKRAFNRHARFIHGFGVGRAPQDREAFSARAAEVMPATVIMFSGCQDSQTSADVQNTASFGLPSDAGPGGAGGACTNSMIKALLQDNYTWVELLKAMRGILDGQYTQIPMLSSSRSMDLTSPFSIQNPEPSGRYRALLIGINYVGTSSELSGCVNDVDTMKRYIEDNGYGDGDIKLLCDDGENDDPTKENIEAGMRWLVEGASSGDSLFFHYSGHGASVKDDDGDEADGKDEALCPLDYDSAGLLRDDDVFKLLVAPLQAGVSLICVLDCCHSGTILDLPFMFKADDDSLAAVEEGSVSEMQQNPDFDFGKVLQVIKDHPALCAAAAVVGGIAYHFASDEQRSSLMGLASSWFG